MNYGCRFEKDVRDFVCSAPQIELPERWNLKSAKVKNQGEVCSCVAHATSSILEAYTNNTVKLSTDFIYGLTRKMFKDEQPGMTLTQACKIVKKYGDVLFSECSTNTEVPYCFGIAESELDNNNALSEAYKYRIDSYYNCLTERDMKYALYKGNYILASVKWRDKFTIDSEGVIHFDNSTEWGGHALMIYGWNEKGFLVQNSWGDSWGNHGSFILPFNDPNLKEAKALVDHIEEGEEKYFVKNEYPFVIDIIAKLINLIINLFSR